MANKLKPLITAPTVSANIKYGPQLEIDNYARLLMFSNHSAPLNIEDGDRRYFVFNSKAQPRDDAYYDRLYDALATPGALNAVYNFLMKTRPFRLQPVPATADDRSKTADHRG